MIKIGLKNYPPDKKLKSFFNGEGGNFWLNMTVFVYSYLIFSRLILIPSARKIF